MQIRKKIPIFMNILICVPLIILTLVTYVYLTKNCVNKSEKNITQLAISEGRALETLVQTNMYQVELVARDDCIIEYMMAPTNKEIQERAQAYLKRSLINERDYEILLMNKQGKILLNSSEDTSGIRLRNPESFKRVIQGENSFADMIYSAIDSEKVINITVPIKTKDGTIIGAVCKVMNNDLFSEFGKSIHIDETGYAFIIDSRFYIVAHPNVESEGALLEQRDLRQEISRQTLNGKESGSYTYTDHNQLKYVAYYRVKDIGWTICVVQNVSEMQKQAFVGSVFIVMTLLILILAINLVNKSVIKGITKPIDLLIDTMNRVAEGDLESFCTYNGDDEFGELARNYNKMLKSLGDSHRNLNEVCEELAVTKQELEHNCHVLEKSKEALVISEERYKVALDAIEEVIWEYHVKDKQFFATDNWSKVIDVVLQDGSIEDAVHKFLEPHAVELLLTSMRQCLAGEIRDFTQEIRFMKNNKKCWLLCKGHAVVDETGQVDKLIGILTDITYNKVNEERVRKLTFFDDLTGCLNKATFIESLDACLGVEAEEKRGALLFIDLDGFKKINDVLSHEVGDKVLNHVGKKLADMLPTDAFIARFGGDEFVIYKTSVDDMDEVHELVYNILSLFQNKLIIGKTNIHLTCSIGIAMYPGDGRDSAMLLKNADTAMYKVKENGKNSYSFYTKSMSQTLDRKLLVEEALREAIIKNSFYLQYQPVVDSNSKETMSCEALIRLYDNELGFISPGEFIPIAEETDLIIEAGDWVLENALKALKRFHEKGYSNFTMNINVSSIQIKEEVFLDKLVSAIKKVGIPPQYIKLEVTESVLMEDVEKSIELFKRVKAMGIKIALDDFGTGYSSLNYLRSIPLDILKIDKSFVDEITTSKVLSEIVDSIINMAHALDIMVVAEGVENEMQFDVLRKKGCDYIQGYYFSKPLSESELEARLRKENHLKRD